MASNPNILLVKVDSTENEVSGVDVQGFPTLKFWGKDKSAEPIEYNGGRDADGIISWLKEHTQYEWVDVAEGEVEVDVAEGEEEVDVAEGEVEVDVAEGEVEVATATEAEG